jgi:hypothetical protein
LFYLFLLQNVRDQLYWLLKNSKGLLLEKKTDEFNIPCWLHYGRNGKNCTHQRSKTNKQTNKQNLEPTHRTFSLKYSPALAKSSKKKMSTPARRRLMRDCKRLQKDPPAGISGAPLDNDVMTWNAVIFGFVEKEKKLMICEFLFVHFYFIIIE